MRIAMEMLTFNRLEFTKIVLENYFKTTKVEHKLLVWDNYSTDGTREWLEKVAKKKYSLKVHFSKQNVGVPNAIRGFLSHPFIKDADLVGKIDNDILVCDNWLENFANAMVKIPKLAVVAAYNKHNPPKSAENYNEVFLSPSLHGMQGSLWLARRSVFKKFPFVENGYAGNWIYFGRLGARHKQLLAYHRKVYYLTDRRQWGGSSPFPDIDYRNYYAEIAAYRDHRRILPGKLSIQKPKAIPKNWMSWSEVKKQDPIYLNLGGGRHCHPEKGYEKYISVDLRPVLGIKYSVQHDLKTPIPLPNNSVDRIHSEDFLEHCEIKEIKKILTESYRLLKVGSQMRIAVPDYNNPKDQPFLKKGRDSRFPGHKTLTHYELIKKLITESPFAQYKFYHYWNKGKFIKKKIDYSLGLVRRTPDNDPRCNPKQPLHATSLIVDLIKEEIK